MKTLALITVLTALQGCSDATANGSDWTYGNQTGHQTTGNTHCERIHTLEEVDGLYTCVSPGSVCYLTGKGGISCWKRW